LSCFQVLNDALNEYQQQQNQQQAESVPDVQPDITGEPECPDLEEEVAAAQPPPPSQMDAVIQVHLVAPTARVLTKDKKTQARIVPRQRTRRLQTDSSMFTGPPVGPVTTVSVGVQCELLLPAPPGPAPAASAAAPVASAAAPAASAAAPADSTAVPETSTAAPAASAAAPAASAAAPETSTAAPAASAAASETSTAAPAASAAAPETSTAAPAASAAAPAASAAAPATSTAAPAASTAAPTVSAAAPAASTAALSDEDGDSDSEDEAGEDDDRALDPDYDPSGDMDNMYDDSDTEVDDDSVTDCNNLRKDVEVEGERQFMVSETALCELLSRCKLCVSDCRTVVRYTRGTLLATQSVCEHGHVTEWTSQRTHSRLPWSNLTTASAVLFSGCNPSKVLQLFKAMKMQMFSARTYMRIQAAYLIPAVKETWDAHQSELIATAQGKRLTLGGDARCDSPGYSAKYSSYSLMDLEKNKVLDVQLIQVNICLYN
jgi:hypothetical protein